MKLLQEEYSRQGARGPEVEMRYLYLRNRKKKKKRIMWSGYAG